MKTKDIDYEKLAHSIKAWGIDCGFQQVGITDTDLSMAETRLLDWLDKGYHGEMTYLSRHGTKRSRPAELHPGTFRIISVRMDYLPPDIDMAKILTDPRKGYVSCYALGRDYHKVLKQRLNQLAQKITAEIGEFGYRAFVDSAPVLEKPIAVKAGLGWQGKHTNVINRKAGSWFFLGELYTDLPLPVDTPEKEHCGRCQACINVCPTRAIIAPYQLDARRCISYLTIELRTAIPEEFRPLIGNRIYGCDDCQLVCPWNRFAKNTNENDFSPRQQFTHAELLRLFAWTEAEFLKYTEGSPIRRIGYDCWLRNIAVALGNAPFDPAIVTSLIEKQSHPCELVREHVDWALNQQEQKRRN